MPVASVTYKADIKDLRQKLESVTDLTRAEARKMVRELNASYRALERSNKRAMSVAQGNAAATDVATKSAKQFAQASQSVAMQLPDVISQLSAGTPALTVFTQQGLQVAQQNMGLLARAAKMATVAIGPLSLAAAFAAIQFKLYSDEQERVRRVQELSAKTAETLKNRSEALRNTALDLKVAVGELTASEAKLLKVRRQTFLESLPALQKLTAAIAEQAAHVEKLEKAQAGQAGDAVANAYMNTAAAQGLVNENLEEERKRLASLEGDRSKLLASLKQQVEQQVKLVEAEDRAARVAGQRRKDAAEQVRLDRERAAALKQLRSMTAASQLAVLQGEERLTEELRRQLERINELERVSKDADAASAARLAAAVEYERQVNELRDRDAQQRAEEERRRIEETERARQQAMQQSLATASSVTGAMSFGWGRAHQVMLEDAVRLQDYQTEAGEHLTKAQNRQLTKRIQAQKRAARNAFEVQQAAAGAQAAVQTALAVATALGSAPWPASLIPAAGALAAGVAQQQAIARQRPSFHRGGGVDLAPDELTATVRRSEFVLNPTGRDMLGDSQLHRANAGQSMGGGQDVIAVSVYKHTRQVDRWKRDGLSSGDPISRAIQRGRLVGHRSNR